MGNQISFTTNCTISRLDANQADDAESPHRGDAVCQEVESNCTRGTLDQCEYADEDEAPRSLYVEPDEAAQAKRLLWDRYLKGGRRK